MPDPDAPDRRAAAPPIRLLPPPRGRGGDPGDGPERDRGMEPDAGGAAGRAAPPLLPLLRPADDPTADTERALAAAAVAARAGDRAARDAIFQALGPKIDRMAAREARRAAATGGALRDGRPWDREDLGQEAYCLLVELIAAWPGDGPFVPYALAYLSWRLADTRRRWTARRRIETHPVAARDEALADESAAAEEALARLAAIAARLPAIEGELLRGIVGRGDHPAAVARRLGIDRRTANDRWAALKIELRRSLEK